LNLMVLYTVIFLALKLKQQVQQQVQCDDVEQEAGPFQLYSWQLEGRFGAGTAAAANGVFLGPYLLLGRGGIVLDINYSCRLDCMYTMFQSACARERWQSKTQGWMDGWMQYQFILPLFTKIVSILLWLRYMGLIIYMVTRTFLNY
ncbi:hypothetical protein ACJX0J_015081, partial [Zea mays]